MQNLKILRKLWNLKEIFYAFMMERAVWSHSARAYFLGIICLDLKYEIWHLNKHRMYILVFLFGLCRLSLENNI